MLFGDVAEVEKVRECARERNRRVDRQAAKHRRQRAEVARVRVRGFRGGPRLLDRAEKRFAKMGAQRIAEQLAKQVDILPQRLVRIGVRRQLSGPRSTGTPGWRSLGGTTHAFDLGTEETMKRQIVAAGAALVVGLGAVASAQAPATAAKPQTPPAAAKNEVSLIGCVEFESDFRKRMAGGRGGVLGSGVGATDEFVLTNVRPVESKGKPGAGGAVYTLTGPQEKNLKRDVGRQIEVIGTIENAGKPDTGADLKDFSYLPRIAIATWHPVNDFCPAK